MAVIAHLLDLIEDAAHLPNLDHPDIFARASYIRFSAKASFDKILIEHVPWFYSYLEPMPKDGWLVLDSSRWTVEQTVQEVLRRIS